VSAGAPATPRREHAGVVAPPPLIFLAGLALGFAFEAAFGSKIAGVVSWPLGALLLALGVVLLSWFLGAFRRAGTPPEPWEPTTVIVTSGPFRFTRNPAYLGMTLVYAGIAVLAGSLWALAPLLLVLPIVDRGVIAREERYLAAKFGQEYLDYKARVRRWI
jgi:protein-S-isoprenylcysteine O-methyltransferase Ste14